MIEAVTSVVHANPNLYLYLPKLQSLHSFASKEKKYHPSKLKQPNLTRHSLKIVKILYLTLRYKITFNKYISYFIYFHK